MRQQVPLAITFIVGLFMAIQFFVPHEFSAAFYNAGLDWMIIIGIFAMLLGIISLFRLHLDKIRKRVPSWGYSLIVIISYLVTVVAGLGWGIEQGTPLLWIYNAIVVSIQSTMFALLAFFIASAAYRAFRAHSIMATILLITAVVVMLGRVPIGEYISIGPLHIPAVSDWFLNVPNLAAKRAITIGVGLGAAAMSLKIILGIERTYLGGGD